MTFWDFARKPVFSGPKVMVLDFGSGSVKVVMTSLDVSKRIGYVIGFGRVPYKENFNIQNLSEPELLAELTNEAIEEATKKAKAKSSECLAVLNGEVLKGSFFKYHHTRPKAQERIDEVELQNIFANIIKDSKENIQNQQPVIASPLVIVDGSVQLVEIDGYHVANPLGFKGAKMDIQTFVFYLTSGQKQYWDSVLKILRLDNRGIISSVFATLQAQLKHSLQEFAGIFIDIGQRSTDVALVRNSVLEGIKTLDLGAQVITQGVAEIFGISFEEALRKRNDYELGGLSEEETRKIESGLRGKVELLREAVLVSLKDFTESVEGLPDRIYLCGGGVRFGLVKKMFSQSAWLSGLPFTRRPAIEVLLPTDVKDVIDLTGGFSGPEAVPQLSAVRWLTRHYNVTSVVEQVFKKALNASTQ